MKDTQSHASQRSPFYLDTFFDDFDRIAGGVLGSVLSGTPVVRQASSFQPTYELVESEQGYLLSFDLPGVPKDDIQIEVKEQQLRVAGERKLDESRNSEGKRFFTERRYGRFERVFTMPNDVDAERIEAHHQDGVLQLMLPKTQKTQPKTIKIGTGESAGFFSKLVGRKDDAKVQ